MVISVVAAYLLCVLVVLAGSQVSERRDPFGERALAALFGPMIHLWPVLLVGALAYIATLLLDK